MLHFLILSLLLFVQAYSGTPPAEEKEKIIWVRFENADLNGTVSFLSLCVNAFVQYLANGTNRPCYCI